jgi:hypothetical protein
MLQAKNPATLILRRQFSVGKRRNSGLNELVEDHDPEQDGHVGD